MKENNKIYYVNVASNHPPQIIKNIPDSVNRRLNSLSKNQEVFENSVGPYQDALRQAGYAYRLHWKTEEPHNSVRNRRRGRHVTWFNPPFCKSVKTNIGAEFFKILAECFPPESKLHKIFNKNTVKISYSCMPNIGKVISGQNKKVLKVNSEPPPCTCTLYECPLEGKCEISGVIYQCSVKETDSGNTQSYIGLTERSFKDRLTKWRRAFRVEGYHNNTLSKHVWHLKRHHIDHTLTWSIVSKAQPYSPAKKSCDLCLREIYYIMFDKTKASLNQRNEFFNHCLHRAKYLLSKQ